MLDLLWLLAHNAFWSGIASLGFAILFNVPVRTLLACALCGAAGYGTRTLMLEMGLGIEGATLVGATLVGFIGQALGWRWHVPALVLTVPGVIPMIPGTFAYNTMIGVLNIAQAGSEADNTLLLEPVVNGIKTNLILMALAVGIAAPSLLFQRYRPMI